MLYIPAGKSIEERTLKQCYEANPHGSSFMFSFNGELKIFKTLSFQEFKREYANIKRVYANSPFVLHFRIATSGQIDLANCHPFNINASLGLSHNGIIRGYGSRTKNDTREFIEQVLTPIVNKYGDACLFKPEVVADLGKHIGAYNKFLIMSNDGKVSIVNEKSGYWVKGLWFSNLDFLPRNHRIGLFD